MQVQIDRRKVRRRIRHRIRKKLRGSAARPRLAVFRSEKHITVQAIDDDSGRTVAHASTLAPATRPASGKTWGLDAAKAVGEALGSKLKDVGITEAVFDRGGFVYHGRVKALAEAIRESGVKF